MGGDLAGLPTLVRETQSSRALSVTEGARKSSTIIAGAGKDRGVVAEGLDVHRVPLGGLGHELAAGPLGVCGDPVNLSRLLTMGA